MITLVEQDICLTLARESLVQLSPLADDNQEQA